jgi:Holliday junction resolvase RusA-like endonuclease
MSSESVSSESDGDSKIKQKWLCLAGFAWRKSSSSSDRSGSDKKEKMGGAKMDEVIDLVSSGDDAGDAKPGAKPSSSSDVAEKGGKGRAQTTRKKKKASSFSSHPDDQFESTKTHFTICIRGKPRPQFRGRPGFNFTRYNPSKVLQNEFRDVAMDVCQHRLGKVPNFGQATLKAEIEYHFPSPVTGLIRNTADIDNLLKFTLDSFNRAFYSDDGQFVRVIAGKAYDDDHGGMGYTLITIESTMSTISY